MKARIKETGEIVQVVSCMKDTNLVEYIENSPSAEHYIISLDDVELIPGEKIINWEQRRYEIAKEAMGALISSPSYQFCEVDNYYEVYIEPSEDVAKKAVEYADALIEELKGGKQ